ncbi:MAG: RagB/SusD family nutrient uptake outer membrane protein [Bacteroidota bacterium]
MRKRITYLVSFLCAVVLLSSCKKYLDLQPQDGITRQEYWKTKENIQAALTGCYASLLGDPANKDKPLAEYLFMWGETRADMIAPGLGITNDELDVMNVNTLTTNSLAKWTAVYRTINYCNTVTDFAPGVLALDNTLTQAQLNAYLAEARALRALMYFYLVRSFRDVPLKLTSTSSDEDLQQLPKTSADTILNQIEKDLAFADSNVVFSHSNATYDKGQITKYTVKTIQADVYLWRDKYQLASDACDYVINSQKFGLIAGNDSWFNTMYYKGNSNETILEFQFDQQKLNSFYGMFTTSKARYYASPNVMDNVFTIDYINDFKDLRGEGASVRTNDNAIWKYLGITYNQIRPSDQSYAHWFVYRYADVLMMKAEALNQIGGRGAEALALVNQIRLRGKALAQTNTNPSPADQAGMADYILQERAREFAFEGKRWYDVLRNAKRNNFARFDLLTTMLTKSVAPNRLQSAINKYKDYNSLYFPIYFYELQVNPNLIQNPYYK